MFFIFFVLLTNWRDPPPRALIKKKYEFPLWSFGSPLPTCLTSVWNFSLFFYSSIGGPSGTLDMGFIMTGTFYINDFFFRLLERLFFCLHLLKGFWSLSCEVFKYKTNTTLYPVCSWQGTELMSKKLPTQLFSFL